MISIGLQVPGCLVPALSRRHCHSHKIPVANEGSRSVPAGFATQTASGLSHSHSRHCRSGICRAEPQDIGGYTPASYITFSEDPNRQCHHHAEVVVDAPIELCFSMWSDWTKLIDFLDLIGQIGLDNNSPDMALFQCFYRWRKLPIMEIVFLLERTFVEANKCIAFKSVYGMPIAGQVHLQEQADGQTKVKLYFTHPIPNLLVQMQVGPFGMETHLMQILKENLATYKSKVEELVPSDWQQQKQQVAARVQQEPPQQQQQQQPQRQQRQPQQPVAQQQQDQQQLAAAPAPAGRKQRTSRRTTTAAAATEAVPAAASKPRSRAPSSRKTATLAAAEAAAAAMSGSSSSTKGSRRSRSASTSAAAAAGDNGTGTGQQAAAAAAKPRRSSTSRRTASTREQ